MAHAGTKNPVLTAQRAGLVGCARCGRVSDPGVEVCPRCGSTLTEQRRDSVQKVIAWLFAGLICYLPANLYPMLQTTILGTKVNSTIVGGVIDLMHHGAYFVAIVVFVASVVIPCTKFAVIGYLAYSIRYRVRLNEHTRTHLYEFVEFVGRWSMVDVFVVAILTALVNLGFIAGFNPGTAAFFFALSVAFTMVSALCLDPRLLWNPTDINRERHD